MNEVKSSIAVLATKHKIVITKQDGSVVKGYFRSDVPEDLDKLASNSGSSFREIPGADYILEDGTRIDVDWSNVKAVFFVSSFKGDRKQESVRFYANGPLIKSIWVEVVFCDGEVIEGFISNSLRHLNDDGFFLQPSSPESNNRWVYVNKASIVSYRVLGVRTQEDT